MPTVITFVCVSLFYGICDLWGKVWVTLLSVSLWCFLALVNDTIEMGDGMVLGREIAYGEVLKFGLDVFCKYWPICFSDIFFF